MLSRAIAYLLFCSALSKMLTLSPFISDTKLIASVTCVVPICHVWSLMHRHAATRNTCASSRDSNACLNVSKDGSRALYQSVKVVSASADMVISGCDAACARMCCRSWSMSAHSMSTRVDDSGHAILALGLLEMMNMQRDAKPPSTTLGLTVLSSQIGVEADRKVT